MDGVGLVHASRRRHYAAFHPSETPTLANYRELFLRGGMLRYLTNSLFLATAVTLGCPIQHDAGYAFAKLQFADGSGCSRR